MGRTEISNESWSCTATGNLYSFVAPQSESARYPALNKPVQNLRRTGSGDREVLNVENIIGTAEGSKSCKLLRSRFKGVVAQSNARWGSQIYQKNRRIWLGTFSLEEEAARAYDTAAKLFRGADATTNFKSDGDHHVKEMAFLKSHSEDEIVSMLQKHTYKDQLEQINRMADNGDEDDDVGLISTVGPVAIQRYNRGGVRTRELLFEKTLTLSDVGRLNRLVIPKVLAEKHFPFQKDDKCSKDRLMTFQDTRGKIWRFRYSYWKSSQSYVLTKGWFRFVRENNLKVGDVISFQQSTGWDRQLFVDYKKMNNGVKAQPKRVPVMRLFGCDIFEVPC